MWYVAWNKLCYAKIQMSVKHGVYCELKSCLEHRLDTVTKVSWVEIESYPQGLTYLEIKVMEKLFTHLLVPISVSTKKKEVIILVVSGVVGGLSRDD